MICFGEGYVIGRSSRVRDSRIVGLEGWEQGYGWPAGEEGWRLGGEARPQRTGVHGLVREVDQGCLRAETLLYDGQAA